MNADEPPLLPSGEEIRKRCAKLLPDHAPLEDLFFPFGSSRESAKGVLAIVLLCLMHYWGENPHFPRPVIDQLLPKAIKVLSPDHDTATALLAYVGELQRLLCAARQ